MTSKIKELKNNLADADLLRNELRWVEPCKITLNPFVFWVDDAGDLRLATLSEVVKGDTNAYIAERHIRSLSDFLLKVLDESSEKGM